MATRLPGMMGYATGLTAQIMRAARANPPKGKKVAPPWKPYVAPVRPPGGTYDPTLDANLRGAQRGMEDTKADASLGNSRGLQDALIHIAAGRHAVEQANADDVAGFSRLKADVGTARTHMWQDFATDKADRGRNYTELGQRQGEQASLQGVSQGGTLAASLAARAANQGREQQAADTSFTRGNEALDQQQQRGAEDLFRSVARRGEAQGVDEAQTGTTLQRSTDDSATKVARAGRELTNFTQDTAASRFFQASQSGQWQAPQRPGNEHGSGRGAYRVVTVGGRRVKVNPAGRIIGRA